MDFMSSEIKIKNEIHSEDEELQFRGGGHRFLTNSFEENFNRNQNFGYYGNYNDQMNYRNQNYNNYHLPNYHNQQLNNSEYSGNYYQNHLSNYPLISSIPSPRSSVLPVSPYQRQQQQQQQQQQQLFENYSSEPPPLCPISQPVQKTSIALKSLLLGNETAVVEEETKYSPSVPSTSNQLNLPILEKTNYKPSAPQTNIDDEVLVIMTDRNVLKLIMDRYVYVRNQVRQTTTYWQCTEKRSKHCHAGAITQYENEKNILKKIRPEHNHPPPVDDVQKFVETHERHPEDTVKKPHQPVEENVPEPTFDPDSICHFIINRVGNPKLVMDGYFYNKRNVRGNVFSWKCEQKTRCAGYAVTVAQLDGTHRRQIIIREHNHAPREITGLLLNELTSTMQTLEDQIFNYKNSDWNTVNVQVEIGEKCLVDTTDDSNFKMHLNGSTFLHSTNLDNIYEWHCRDTTDCESKAITNFVNNTHYLKSYDNSHNHPYDNKKSEEKCKMITTKRGQFKILREGYFYNLLRRKENLSYWRCMKKSDCTGALLTISRSNSYYLRATRPHNHESALEKNVVDERPKNEYPKNEPSVQIENSINVAFNENPTEDDWHDLFTRNLLTNNVETVIKDHKSVKDENDESIIEIRNENIDEDEGEAEIELDEIENENENDTEDEIDNNEDLEDTANEDDGVEKEEDEKPIDLDSLLPNVTMDEGNPIDEANPIEAPNPIEGPAGILDLEFNRKTKFNRKLENWLRPKNQVFRIPTPTDDPLEENDDEDDNDEGEELNIKVDLTKWLKPKAKTAIKIKQEPFFNQYQNNNFHSRHKINNMQNNKSRINLESWLKPKLSLFQSSTPKIKHDSRLAPLRIFENKIECEVIQTTHGNFKLIHEGYLYVRNRVKARNHYWNCEERKKSYFCPGYAITELWDGKQLLRKIREHIHDPNPNKLQVNLIVNRIRENSSEFPDLSSQYLVDEELKTLSNDLLALLPSRKALMQMINRKRKLQSEEEESEDMRKRQKLIDLNETFNSGQDIFNSFYDEDNSMQNNADILNNFLSTEMKSDELSNSLEIVDQIKLEPLDESDYNPDY